MHRLGTVSNKSRRWGRGRGGGCGLNRYYMITTLFLGSAVVHKLRALSLIAQVHNAIIHFNADYWVIGYDVIPSRKSSRYIFLKCMVDINCNIIANESVVNNCLIRSYICFIDTFGNTNWHQTSPKATATSVIDFWYMKRTHNYVFLNYQIITFLHRKDSITNFINRSKHYFWSLVTFGMQSRTGWHDWFVNGKTLKSFNNDWKFHYDMVTFWHHEACWVIRTGSPSDGIFNAPHDHIDSFFF